MTYANTRITESKTHKATEKAQSAGRQAQPVVPYMQTREAQATPRRSRNAIVNAHREQVQTNTPSTPCCAHLENTSMNNMIFPALTNDATATMTSVEIAELVESRHDKVKQSIERLVNRGVIKLPPMGEVSTGKRGPQSEVFIFSGEQGKRDSIIVVAQLSPEFTARLVDRWKELEDRLKGQTPAVPQTYTEALRLALAQAEELERTQAALEYANPRAAHIWRTPT